MPCFSRNAARIAVERRGGLPDDPAGLLGVGAANAHAANGQVGDFRTHRQPAALAEQRRLRCERPRQLGALRRREPLEALGQIGGGGVGEQARQLARRVVDQLRGHDEAA